MVSADNRTGLYVAIPLYFVVLGACAYWARRRSVQLTHDGHHEGARGAISVHYLGGRDFGWLVTAGTFFASLFSGYTVIGVPVSAYYSFFHLLAGSYLN